MISTLIFIVCSVFWCRCDVGGRWKFLNDPHLMVTNNLMKMLKIFDKLLPFSGGKRPVQDKIFVIYCNSFFWLSWQFYAGACTALVAAMAREESQHKEIGFSFGLLSPEDENTIFFYSASLAGIWGGGALVLLLLGQCLCMCSTTLKSIFYLPWALMPWEIGVVLTYMATVCTIKSGGWYILACALTWIFAFVGLM